MKSLEDAKGSKEQFKDRSAWKSHIETCLIHVCLKIDIKPSIYGGVMKEWFFHFSSAK